MEGTPVEVPQERTSECIAKTDQSTCRTRRLRNAALANTNTKAIEKRVRRSRKISSPSIKLLPRGQSWRPQETSLCQRARSQIRFKKVQAELTQDAANDQAIMDKMDSWCVTNRK